MSRSKKGSKPPGFDFWSRRPKSFFNDKDLTHRAERAQAKEEVTEELKQMEKAMITKPMLAVEADLDSLKYPALATPKLDGIRCVVVGGKALSRTFKPIPNHHIRNLIEQNCPDGFDGEIIIPGADFNATQSQVMSFEGTPNFQFAVFDYVTEGLDKPYVLRVAELESWFEHAPEGFPVNVRIISPVIVRSESELTYWSKRNLELGYEGTMLRSPESPYKCGRSTVREGYLLKIKPFQDSEAEVIGFVEQLTNNNEAKKNEVGATKRSKAKANLVPNGKLGALQVRDLKTGVEFEVGTGFTDEERRVIWEHQDIYLGKFVTYQFLPYGVKDKPRNPSFKGFRAADDIS